MAEYIDKNATVGILEAMSRNADCECIKKRLEKAAKRVSTMPDADVAPVVRCKDCKYSYDDISGLCCSHGVCVDCNVPENFYCSYGERKKDRNNG